MLVLGIISDNVSEKHIADFPISMFFSCQTGLILKSLFLVLYLPLAAESLLLRNIYNSAKIPENIKMGSINTDSYTDIGLLCPSSLICTNLAGKKNNGLPFRKTPFKGIHRKNRLPLF